MGKILVHVSDEKYDILDPRKTKEGAICLSEDLFISFFGQWLYLFDFDVLRRNFRMDLYKNVAGVAVYSSCRGVMAEKMMSRFQSDDLNVEWRIEKPIDVERFSIGIIRQWNWTEGILEEMMQHRIIKKRINFWEEHNS